MHYVDSIGSYISQQEGTRLLQFSLGLSAVLVQYAAVFYGILTVLLFVKQNSVNELTCIFFEEKRI